LIKQATLQYREFAGCREQKTLRSARHVGISLVHTDGGRVSPALRLILVRHRCVSDLRLNFAPDLGIIVAQQKVSIKIF
jgi:hypothetical protein